MNIAKHTLTDEAKDGIWLQYDDATFLVASSKTPAFTREITKSVRKHRAAELKAHPELLQAITIAAMAKHVLKDWKGVEDDGEAFPPTEENKVHLITQAPDFREWLTDVAQDLDTFREDALEDEADDLKSGAGMAP